MAEERKYAGKYESPEALEKAYQELQAHANDLTNKNKDLESSYKLPDDYKVEVKDIDEKVVVGIKTTAKEIGLTQAQFEKYLLKTTGDTKAQRDAQEAIRKELGEGTINILNEHVTKYYPEEIRATVMEKALADKGFREKELKRREDALKSVAPGVNIGSITKPVSYDELKAAFKKKEENPRDPKVLDAYISLAAEYARQDKKAA